MSEIEQKAVRFNMSLSPILAEKLDMYAKENGLPKSSVVNLALADFFKQRDLMENGVQMIFDMVKENPNYFKELLTVGNNEEKI